MTGPLTVTEFVKNNTETIRVALVEYGGHQLCDVRILADYAGARGDRQPTKKGICLSIGLLPTLIAALQSEEEASR
ncbi:transcriptional coactivator p15/PC4 family protein [Methylobacterium phyllosphaerae]